MSSCKQTCQREHLRLHPSTTVACGGTYPLKTRILPAFSALEDEADKIATGYYERASESADEDTTDYDMVEAAESAQELGSAHYCTMKQVGQGVLNLFTVACYHMFEQQIFQFLMYALLGPVEKTRYGLFKLDVVQKRLGAEGIDLSSFSSWTKTDELRAYLSNWRPPLARGGECADPSWVRRKQKPPTLESTGPAATV